jgi:hypothetical protein
MRVLAYVHTGTGSYRSKHIFSHLSSQSRQSRGLAHPLPAAGSGAGPHALGGVRRCRRRRRWVRRHQRGRPAAGRGPGAHELRRLQPRAGGDAGAAEKQPELSAVSWAMCVCWAACSNYSCSGHGRGRLCMYRVLPRTCRTPSHGPSVCHRHQDCQPGAACNNRR